MFGKDWQYGQAMIVSRSESGLKREPMGAGPATYSYVADVQPDDGSPGFRASFDQNSQGLRYRYPAVGEQVRVKFDARHHKVEIEQLAPSDMVNPGTMGLDPELAELMRLEEAERTRAAGSMMAPGAGGLDPELAELMRLEEEERARLATPAGQQERRLAELELLAELHSSGVLTDAEFAAEKAKILGQP